MMITESLGEDKFFFDSACQPANSLSGLSEVSGPIIPASELPCYENCGRYSLKAVR